MNSDKTVGALLRDLDAKATPGPLRCEYDSCDCGAGYGCGHSAWVHAIRGPGEPVSAGGRVRGFHEVPDLPIETWETLVALRNALLRFAAVLDAADALRDRVGEVLERDRLYGGDPDCEPALQDEHKGHHYDLTGLSNSYDDALADLRAALEGGPK